MKHILESHGVMEAYANIDICNLMLRHIVKQINTPLSAIEKAIDLATGNDKQQLLNVINDATELLESIVESKKFIVATHETELDLIAQLKRVKKSVDDSSENRKDVVISFGLEQQGHIPTIQAELKRWNSNNSYGNDMTYCKGVWESIGKKIG